MKFNHPGGNSVLVDDETVFKSIHPQPMYQKILNLYDFKFSKKSPYIFDSEFAKSVKSLNFSNSHKAPLQWWLRFGIINSALIFTEYYFLKQPTILNSIALGTIYASMGLCIGHDASHGAIGNKYINEFCSYYMDFIGNTNYWWHYQHITKHHPYTNESGLDPDVDAGEPFIVYDNNKKRTPKWHTIGQLLLGFLIVYDIRKLKPVINIPIRKQVISILLRAYLYYKLIHPLRFWYGQIVMFVAGAILGVLFAVSHNTIHIKRNVLSEKNNDWYKNQIETSCSYGGPIANFLTGGLNYQIEHHVFPHMNSCYYDSINPKLKEICKKHDVKFNHYPTFFENAKYYFSMFD